MLRSGGNGTAYERVEVITVNRCTWAVGVLGFHGTSEQYFLLQQ